MIKAIILDIDGVIVGEKIGFNSPTPHDDVLSAMKAIHAKGIPIVLCTAKPHYSVQDIIQGASLANPHITDAGAVIIDPIDNIIVEKHSIDKVLAKKVLDVCLENKIYVEFYTVDDYFIQQGQTSDITKQHTHILQREPQVVSSLSDSSLEQEITKIMPIAKDLEDKKRVAAILEQFSKQLSISWAVHPVALPAQFGIMTVRGSSKKEGAVAIVKSLHLSFDDVLGIGDSTSDWSFIELCGYGATLANGSQEIKDLIATKGTGKFFIAPHVDENGILEIFRYFFKL